MLTTSGTHHKQNDLNNQQTELMMLFLFVCVSLI